MKQNVKIRLSLYGIISAISYSYLVMVPKPGISIPIFLLIQFTSVYLALRNRPEIKNTNGILMFIPILILSLNYFISGSNMWRITNFIAITTLYSIMFLIVNNQLSLDRQSSKFIFNVIANIFVPICSFSVPFKWFFSGNKSSSIERFKIKRILMGIMVSMPCIIFLLIILSSADMIFSERVRGLMIWFNNNFNLNFIYRLFVGLVAGLYLFGFLYTTFPSEESDKIKHFIDNADGFKVEKKINADLIVINILLISIVTVYTAFISIQFKYLFAGAELPYGLNFAEYARRGFFELVFLSVINVGLILLSIFLLKEKIYYEKTIWSNVTKALLLYLCTVTAVLLVSSFYRMMLYDNEYGFTRLRIIVYLFLLFEAIGLAVTLKFILKPSFNIIAVYCIIIFMYYLTLNIVPIDYVIAKRNIDMYFKTNSDNLDREYLISLSTDAAPQIQRLLESKDVDIITKYKAKMYFNNLKTSLDNSDSNWQCYNLADEKAKRILTEILKSY